mgnify:FL=1|tara:strand:+ start:7225 stop:7725 length:501 start_codon:yes stop_codon:yes gene_type:complete
MTRIAKRAAVKRRPGSDDDSEESSSQSVTATDHLNQQIAALSSLGVADLRKAWAERFHRPAPPIQSADVLLRLFAWRLQVASLGDLDAETSSKLARLKTSLPPRAAEASSWEATHLARMLRLAFLAPDIQQAIIAGRQPQSLRLRALLETDLPANWSGQRQVLGFA